MASDDPQVTSDSDGEVDFGNMTQKEKLERQLFQLQKELDDEWKKSKLSEETTEMYKSMKKDMHGELAARLDEQAIKNHI